MIDLILHERLDSGEKNGENMARIDGGVVTRNSAVVAS
jgi:hypothetical protein